MMTQDADRTRTGRIVQLSVELLDVPKNELCKVFEHFDDALTGELFTAVQDVKETFEVTFVNLSGEEVKETFPEEHIASGEGWERWLAEQRQASRWHVIRVTEEFRIDAASVTVPGEFEMLARLRIEALQKKKKEADRLKKKGGAVAATEVVAPPKKARSGRSDGTSAKRSGSRSKKRAGTEASPDEADGGARELALAND